MSASTNKDGGIDWKAVLPTALTAAIFIGGVLWAAHSEISKINERLEVLDEHISRVETAVRIVGAKQGSDTKTLIDEALAVARNAAANGHVDNAKAIVAYANQLLAEQKQSKTAVPQVFFDSAVKRYQSLATTPVLQEPARSGTLLLAEYRSSLQPQPPLPITTESTLPVIAFFGNATTNPRVVLQSTTYNMLAPLYAKPYVDLVGEGNATLYYVATHYRPPFQDEVVVAPTKRWEDSHVTISGINIYGGSQALDGFIWDNVTLINVHVRYTGGTALLRNVRFVNCTFDLPPDNKGMTIADYVALGRTDEFQVG